MSSAGVDRGAAPRGRGRGVSGTDELFCHADVATIWGNLSNVTDHALLDDSKVPAEPTTSYWPMLLAGQTLGNPYLDA